MLSALHCSAVLRCLLVFSRFALFARIFVDCSSGCDSVLCSNPDLDFCILTLCLHLELFMQPFSDNDHGAEVLVAMNAFHLCRLLSWCPSQALHLRRFQCSCLSVQHGFYAHVFQLALAFVASAALIAALLGLLCVL